MNPEKTTINASASQDVQPIHGFGPNKKWTFVDAAGHAHRYIEPTTPGGPCYPTLALKTDFVACDDPDCDCGGYEDSHMECALCGEVIRPSVVPTTYYIADRINYSVDGVPVSEDEFKRLIGERLAP